MKNFTTTFILFFFLATAVIAQNNDSFYATMSGETALKFKQLYPNDIQILATKSNESAVYLTEEVSHKIHESVQIHGPGYIFRPSKEKALQALNRVQNRNSFLEYTITETDLVNECLDLVNNQNIEDDILELQAYGTRHHETSQGEQSVYDLKAKWDAMIAQSGRTDIHTRIYNHQNTPMPSVILTIDGANTPDEYVIIGGHLDSTSFWDINDAPGADDNASGISSLNEMIRVLIAKEFVPNRTIEVMAYAAEEIGLVGSEEIASEYASNGINVGAYVQFDMTGYNGSNEDVWISTDWYNSSALNNFLVDLMDHYNGTGNHAFTYNFTECGYGCSDHASWANNGYEAAFPFEAKFSESNPKIHTDEDIYSFFDTPEHSAKFTKLGLQFLIEAAKPQTMSVNDFSENAIAVFVNENILNYRLNNLTTNVSDISIYNIGGQSVFTEKASSQSGSVNLTALDNGFYIVKFNFTNGRTLSKKFILN
ncbi:M28 family peptidase [Aequorivita xiaoshiensis]|uniref:M20/M25/M40 family metallo-hydrolase n=1 Tax=Aequorivita xiaoshiensis TaxID=2874476 RepID=A0A9X1U391_9FLAO|nr:M28 family peptidase [Aequorivita xiaoshiensis]MCG2429570.1 M20/M25/M40 family metallo-hydrolase [Aequorivita xiaoshiensis]